MKKTIAVIIISFVLMPFVASAQYHSDPSINSIIISILEKIKVLQEQIQKTEKNEKPDESEEKAVLDVEREIKKEVYKVNAVIKSLTSDTKTYKNNLSMCEGGHRTNSSIIEETRDAEKCAIYQSALHQTEISLRIAKNMLTSAESGDTTDVECFKDYTQVWKKVTAEKIGFSDMKFAIHSDNVSNHVMDARFDQQEELHIIRLGTLEENLNQTINSCPILSKEVEGDVEIEKVNKSNLREKYIEKKEQEKRNPRDFSANA